MKDNTLHRILGLAIMALIGLSSCEKRCDLPDIIEVPLEWNGYISFEAEPTRAELVTSMSGKGFGVYGYKYLGNWTTYRNGTTSFPNVFDSTPEQVSWDGTKHTYTEVQEWEEKKYTFFGYYPYGFANISPSAATYSGTPYIDYTMTFDGSTANLKDVMTAKVNDTDGSVSESVVMPFEHRLSCLRVEARNLNEPDTEHGQTLADVQEKVKNLTVTISSKMYGSVRIPLDPDMPLITAYSGTPAAPSVNSSTTKTFSIISGNDVATVDYTGTSNTTVLSEDNNIIFIPQGPDDDLTPSNTEDNETLGDLTGNITFTDKFGRSRPFQSTDIGTAKKKWSGTAWINDEGEGGLITADDVEADQANCHFDSNKKFDPSKIYSLVITFSNQTIQVSIIESGDWDDKDQQITFE